MSEIRVLIVDDERAFREPLANWLGDRGYDVDEAANGLEATEQVRSKKGGYNVLLIDQVLIEGPDGIETMKAIHAEFPAIPAVIFTQWGDRYSGLLALREGAYRYFFKPFDPEELDILIRHIVEFRGLERKLEFTLREREWLQNLLGIASAMQSKIGRLDEILQVIAEAVPKLTGADEGAISLFEPLSGKFRVHGTTFELSWYRHFREPTLSRLIVNRGEHILIPDTLQDDQVNPQVIESGIRSFAGMPIGKLAVLYAYSRKPERFSSQDIQALTMLANQAAIAIQNARLFELERTLREAAERLGSALDLKEIPGMVLELVQKIVPYDTASIQLLKENELEIVGGRGFEDDDLRRRILGRTFALDDKRAPNSWVIREKHPLVLIDAPAAYESFRTPPHNRIRAWIGVPLMVADEIIGMITLDKNVSGFYTEEHANMVMAFANQAAIAIQVAKSVEEMKLLRELSVDLTSSLELREVLKYIARSVLSLIQAESSTAVVYDERKGRYIQEGVTADPKRPPVIEEPRQKGYTNLIMETGKPQNVSDLEQDELAKPFLLKMGVRSLVGVPIKLSGKAVGALFVHCTRPRCFSEREVSLVSLLANQAAIAIQNAWAFKERERRMAELEHLRKAGEALAGAVEIEEVLRQIVRGAREVLNADSAAVWPYDASRGCFDLDLVVADGISGDILKTKESPAPGGTADTVMKEGFLTIGDVEAPQYSFLGESTRRFLKKARVKCFVGIALKADGEPSGVLYVNYKDIRLFDSEQKITLRAFASEAALAIRKARLLRQVRQTLGHLEKVAFFMRLGRTEGVLQAVAEGVREAIGCDLVTLYNYDQERNEIGGYPVASGDFYARDKIYGLGVVKGESVVWKILELGELFAADAPSDPVMKGPFVEREQIRSSAGITLEVGKQKVGVLFASYRRPHRFTEEDKPLIRTFADQAAVAIYNAQLYEKSRKETGYLRTLCEASQAITVTLELDEVLDSFLAQATQITEKVGKGEKAHIGIIQFLEDNRLVFVRAWPPGELKHLKAKLGDYIDIEKGSKVDGGRRIGVTGRTAKTGKHQLVPDASQDPDYIAYRSDTHSELAVPLKIQDKVIGVLDVEHPEVNAFDEEDVNVLTALANQAAIAIQNARRYEELERTKTALAAKTAVAWMGMVSSVWRHAITRDATIIRDAIELLRRDLAKGASHEKIEERLTFMERTARTIQETPIIAPLSVEEGVESVRINAFLQERVPQILKAYEVEEVQVDLQLMLSETATIRVSREWLRRALDIIVHNAIEAMEEVGRKVLTVITERVGREAKIRIRDTGRGIPQKVQAMLFKEPIPKPEGAKGAGVGLLLAQTIVQTYRGEIEVETTGPAGTTMVITLSLEQ